MDETNAQLAYRFCRSYLLAEKRNGMEFLILNYDHFQRIMDWQMMAELNYDKTEQRKSMWRCVERIGTLRGVCIHIPIGSVEQKKVARHCGSNSKTPIEYIYILCETQR